MTHFESVLILAPHPDDGEFGAGGTIRKFADEGKIIYYAVFSPCNKSLPEGFEEDAIYGEMYHATDKLGIPENQIITFRFPVREFPAYRQEILEELAKLKKELKPDLVLLPNTHDIHQDHQVISAEGIRAFKTANILGYELPWNNFTSELNVHQVLEESHMQAKVDAINEYKSQSFRGYKDEEFIRSLGRTRGVVVGAKYAEAFQSVHFNL